MSRILFAVAVLAASVPLSAQMVKSEQTASNGVKISVSTDEFASRAEYVAPSIDFKADRNTNGAVFIARIKKGAVVGPIIIQGFVIYSGDWRYYTKAVFRGGDAVDFTRTGGKVGSCRYGCTLTEEFTLELSASEAAKHAVDGMVDIQIRANDGATALFTIPVSYLAAVNEVAK